MLKKLLLICCFFTTQSYSAELSYLGLTKHIDASGKEIHPSVLINIDNSWTGGGFVNSYNKWSWYGAKRFEYNDIWAEIGGQSGYGAGIDPSLRFGYKVNKDLTLFTQPRFVKHHSFEIDKEKPIILIGIFFTMEIFK